MNSYTRSRCRRSSPRTSRTPSWQETNLEAVCKALSGRRRNSSAADEGPASVGSKDRDSERQTSDQVCAGGYEKCINFYFALYCGFHFSRIPGIPTRVSTRLASGSNEYAERSLDWQTGGLSTTNTSLHFPNSTRSSCPDTMRFGASRNTTTLRAR